MKKPLWFMKNKRIERLVKKLDNSWYMNTLRRNHEIGFIVDSDGFIVTMSLKQRNGDFVDTVYLPADSNGYLPIELTMEIISDIWAMRR